MWNNKNIVIIQKIILNGLLLLLMGCEIINPDEEIPSYVRINSASLTTTYSSQGTNSNKIMDVWFYADNEFIGVFEFPVTFPVLKESKISIQILPGIMDNGIDETRINYKFYDTYTITLDLIKGQTITVEPAFIYTSYTNFAWKEDFESSGISLELTSNSLLDTIIKTSNEFQFEQGKFAAAFLLDQNKSYFECASLEEFNTLKSGTSVYLELNYKTNIEFTVGIWAIKPTGVTKKKKLIITPTDSWNKIYVNLTSEVHEELLGTTFKISFEGQKSDTISNPEILIDNIKLLY